MTTPTEASELELPELDKSDDSDDVDVGGFQLIQEDEGELEDDEPLDAFEVEIEEQQDSGGDEPVPELDVGIELLLNAPEEERAALEQEPLQLSHDELGISLDLPSEADDGAEVDLGDDGLESLPELAREDAEPASAEVEAVSLLGAPEGDIPRGPRFEVEQPLTGQVCTALDARFGLVIASGDELVLFTEPAARHPLPKGTRATSIALAAEGKLLLATTRGLLEQTLGSAPGAAFLELPEAARGSGADVVELACASGGYAFLRLASGAVLRRRGELWERHEPGGRVRALSSSGSGLALLVIAKQPTLQISSDGGSSFRELLLPAPAATVALGSEPLLRVRDQLVALADAERGLCVSADGGETFRMVTGAVNLSALSLGEYFGEPRVFAALHREAQDKTELLMVEAASGAVSSIAELYGTLDDEAGETGRTLALAWDGAALWAAGGYGVVRLRPTRVA